ncbi:MAG: hypothetical protein ACXQTE_05210 [Methanosarcinaceae archaeon]
MQNEDILDWMLAEAKKHPHTIPHDFDTRFRVWCTQIIPDRVEAIRRSLGSPALVTNMIKLTLADSDRLKDRATSEHVRNNSCWPQSNERQINMITEKATEAISTFIAEVKI